MSDAIFLDNYYKIKSYNLINPIISVMARHMYNSSTILKVLSTRDNEELKTSDESLDDGLELDISILGARLLERLIDSNELKKMIKNVKIILK
jgi:hypothetical protein